ncbi:hypothetical protein DFJ63DRAFT_333962 [Scheffersomyces coipomensis]|uniref:uncharacterized protein n=1 Tax=Scheffersomyces coipomensis TaxID=1788519 RepID=UPI00315DB443
MAVKTITRITSLTKVSGVNKNKKNKATRSRRRSKNGCLSCKRLKIKCDEKKPSCEYCLDTNRQCSYVSSPISPSPVLTPINDNTPIKAFNDKDYDEEESRLVKLWAPPTIGITINNRLINSINYLNVKSYEMELLDFFRKNCLFLFTFGLKSHRDNANVNGFGNVYGNSATKTENWSGLIPQMFFQSEIVRNSICSFSSLNLFSIIQEEGTDPNRIHHASPFKRFGRPAKYDTNLLHNHQLFNKTCGYFNQAINQTNQQLASLNHDNIFIDPPNLAKELVISNILIFTFLAIHPHNLMPLVDFNGNHSRGHNDFLSICNGIKSTVIYCLPTLIENDCKILTVIFNDADTELQQPPTPPCQHDYDVPIIASFKRDLDQSFHTDHDLKPLEYMTISQTLKMLNKAVKKCIFINFPKPIFRWILITANPFFHQLIYKQNLMALRLMNIFSHLCLMIRFQLFNDSNMWIDYIEWFKSFNFMHFNQTWKFKLDEKLYELSIVRKFGFKLANYEHLATLDPENEEDS